MFPYFVSMNISCLPAGKLLDSRFPAQVAAFHLHSVMADQLALVSKLKRKSKKEVKLLADLKEEAAVVERLHGMVDIFRIA